MGRLLRPLFLSLLLGLLEAMRTLDKQEVGRPAVRWAVRVPLDAGLAQPARCWFWGESPMAN